MPEKEELAVESNATEQAADNGDHQEEETELESEIIRQVEYYFGDSNLPRDKFLREQVKLDDGWVPLEVLTSFNRLAKLSKDLDVLATALNKSTSGLLEISEDNKKVRRNPELPVPEMNEERRKEVQSRTIYAKGFAKDAALDDILKFFKAQGDVENVIMRRYIDKPTKERKFKGSVFATFKVKDEANKFVESKGLKYGETELIIRWQDEYLKEKQEEYVARKEKKENKQKEKAEAREEKEDIKLPTGTVLKFTGCHEKMTRENIRDALTPIGGEVAYIDFNQGDKDGWVRFSKENAAKDAIAKITDGKLKIGESETVFTLLEGDDEKAYLDKTVEEMSKRRRNNRNNKGGKFNNKFKGNKHHGRKRKQEHGGDEPAAKIKA